MLNATHEYRKDMDPLVEFLEEKSVILESAWVSTASLFAEYREWAKETGVGRPLGKKSFSQYMVERFIPSNRGSKGGRGFRGVGLLSGYETLSEQAREKALAGNVCYRCRQSIPTEEIHSYGAQGEVTCTKCADTKLEGA